jgi:hypothetical protein
MLETSDRLSDNYDADYPYQPRPATVLEDGPTASIGLWPKAHTQPFPWLAVVLVGYFAVSDVAVMPLTWVFDKSELGAMFVFVSFGAILAQAALLSAGLVFGPGHYWKRLLGFWIATVVFCILWTMGFELLSALRGWSMSNWNDVRFGILALPLATIAIQSPLWFFRLYRGWRLVLSENDKREPPLSIRDYMLGTAIVALSVTFARLAVQAKDLNVEYWEVWSIFFGIAAILSLASVIPALPLMFRFDWRFGMMGLMLYAAIVAGSFLAITEYFSVSPISPFNIWSATGFMLVFISFAGFVGLGLKAVRDMRFVLVNGRSMCRLPTANQQTISAQTSVPQNARGLL